MDLLTIVNAVILAVLLDRMTQGWFSDEKRLARQDRRLRVKIKKEAGGDSNG